MFSLMSPRCFCCAKVSPLRTGWGGLGRGSLLTQCAEVACGCFRTRWSPPLFFMPLNSYITAEPQIKYTSAMNGRSAIAIIVSLCMALAGCATVDNVVTPENRRTLSFDRDYQAVYRIISEGLQRCVSPGAVRATMYPDTRTARVLIAGSGGASVGSVHEIRAAGDGKTVVDFYNDVCLTCSADQANERVQRLHNWIEGGSTDC